MCFANGFSYVSVKGNPTVHLGRFTAKLGSNLWQRGVTDQWNVVAPCSVTAIGWVTVSTAM